jgi:hypothetical protein
MAKHKHQKPKRSKRVLRKLSLVAAALLLIGAGYGVIETQADAPVVATMSTPTRPATPEPTIDLASLENRDTMTYRSYSRDVVAEITRAEQKRRDDIAADEAAKKKAAEEAAAAEKAKKAAEAAAIEEAKEAEKAPEPKPTEEAYVVPEPWKSLAECESGGNWAINTGNGYFGGLQFRLETWQAYGGSGYPHEHSAKEQIRIAEKLRADRGFQPWPSCSKKLGLLSDEPAASSQKNYDVGDVKPHVQAAANEVGTKFNIDTVYGLASRGGRSDHPIGLALDFMVSGSKGWDLANYVLANASRLKVSYVIYEQKINSLDGRGWRLMENRGSITANHFDHVHVSFHP